MLKKSFNNWSARSPVTRGISELVRVTALPGIILWTDAGGSSSTWDPKPDSKMNGRLCCTYAGGYASIGTVEYYYLSMKYNGCGGDVEEMRAAAGPPISIQLECGDIYAEISSILYGMYVLKLVVCVFVCLLQRLMHMHAVWCCSAMPSAGTSFIADALEPLPAISQGSPL